MNILQKAIKNPRKAVYVLKYKIFKVIGNHDYKKFIVLTRSRTGSFLLLSFLESHPNISTQKEIFSRIDGRDYQNILRSAFSRQPYFIRAVGFKIFYYHPLDDPHCGLWQDLEQMQSLHIIHLKRRNILRTLISRKIAGASNVWTKTDEKASPALGKKAIELTVDELKEGFQQTCDWEEEGEKRFIGHPLINMDYEDLAKDPQTEFRKLTDFLGLPYVPPSTYLKKQNPERIEDLLKDYDRLKQAFMGSPWESFFEN